MTSSRFSAIGLCAGASVLGICLAWGTRGEPAEYTVLDSECSQEHACRGACHLKHAGGNCVAYKCDDPDSTVIDNICRHSAGAEIECDVTIGGEDICGGGQCKGWNCVVLDGDTCTTELVGSPGQSCRCPADIEGADFDSIKKNLSCIVN